MPERKKSLESLTLDPQRLPKVLAIYLKLSEYPILSRKIRERMREELFRRGVITREQFEREVREKAIQSQRKEGLTDPMAQETPEEWAERLQIIRDHLTDFYFALNLPHDLFEEIVRSILQVRQPGREVILTFNPELAPWSLLFSQAETYETLPPEKKKLVQHHLQEILVVLIRGMISDQLDFVGVARRYFNIFDLKEIYRRRIGRGKIGGKAAGIMLAYNILRRPEPEDPFPFHELVQIPESYFLGADVFYDFVALNDLYAYTQQKYKGREEIEADYPEVRKAFLAGAFPPEVVERLRDLLRRVGRKPLIVRSSSLLEDNFGTSFAGKYESHFCPNQGTLEENLEALLTAIRKVYASTLNPDALIYRQKVGLVDYDERMAILIQEVQGFRYRNFFFPMVAGVGFGRNPFRWHPKIRREDGLLRMVWGLGTRAVERVANDYPRMVALSHPTLRPELSVGEIRRYSQRFVDVIDLEANAFKTLPVRQVLDVDYPHLELIASVDEGTFIRPLAFLDPGVRPEDLVLTFDRLLRETPFPRLMRAILKKLERAYGRPVDMEFALEVRRGFPHPEFTLYLLQCRPQSVQREVAATELPQMIAQQDILFVATRFVPDGVVQRVEYVVYVDPRRYAAIPEYTIKKELGRVVGRLNKRLEGRRFILIGPGRWGTANVDLGVHVTYADIYNARMLVEVSVAGQAGSPEVSYGTHFFQDLVESNIYPLPLYLDAPGAYLNEAFFREAPNRLADLSPQDAPYAEYVRVVHLPEAADGKLLEVVMSAEEDRAIGYLRRYEASSSRA